MIANTIVQQLGTACLALLGAHHFVDLEDGLQFSIQGCDTINMVQIILDHCDTYTVKFWKLTIKVTPLDGDLGFRETKCQQVFSYSGIYCDMLHDIIEEKTGLRTRFS